MKRAIAALTLAMSGIIVGCGALLDLPDPTVDPLFGQEGGAFPDGYVPPPSDGAPTPDGPSNDPEAGKDGAVLPDGGCNCFGGTCDGGVCQPFALYTATDPNLIDNDGKLIYFANGVTEIDALDPNKPDAGVTPLTTTESSVRDLRVNGGYVYFTNLPLGSKGVYRCPTAGGCGGSNRTTYESGNTHSTYGVATDGTTVYFTYDDVSGGVYKCPVAGCGSGPVLVATVSDPMLIVTDSTNLYWFVDNSGDGVFSCKAASCTAGGNTDSTVRDLALDPGATFVYWVDDTSVWKRPLPTGAASQVAAVQTGAFAIRVDGSYVYWLTKVTGIGALRRCPVGADCLGTPKKIETIASGLNDPYGLTLTSDSAYYTTRGDSTIWRFAK